ncbi:MAG: hypothetical protein U9R17_19255 [Thermodesulfobacteriota bacterium]|nr:hypothetical protein [Thermodesulfobacteriota bacterium]
MKSLNNYQDTQYKIGPSNGTTPVPKIFLDEEDRLIDVESITLFGDKQLLDRRDVSASLDESLKKYAEVWSELSKY